MAQVAVKSHSSTCNAVSLSLCSLSGHSEGVYPFRCGRPSCKDPIVKLVPTAFSFRSTFPLPTNLVRHVIDGTNLLIAPELPAWTTATDAECDALLRMSRGATIEEACLCLKSWGVEDARGDLSRLLTKMAVDGFMPNESASAVEVSKTTLQLHVTNACNLRCTHCYVSSGIAFPDEIGLDDCKRIVDAARHRYEKVFVSISGGEPLLVPWLPDLLAYVKSFNLRVSLLSNGMLWTDKRVAALRPYVDLVNVSLDGASADVHDAIQGPGAFRQALRGVQRLGAAGIDVGINVCLMKSNLQDVEANLFALVRSLPFQVSVQFGKFVDEGRGFDIRSESPTADEMARLLPILAEKFLSSGWSPTSTSKRATCGFGASYSVYANGDVSPCLSPRYIAGNILRENVEDVLERVSSNAARAHVDLMPLCRSCDLRYICGGKCHLAQLTQGQNIAQNTCDAEYRVNYYRKLARRAASQETVMMPIVSRVL